MDRNARNITNRLSVGYRRLGAVCAMALAAVMLLGSCNSKESDTETSGYDISTNAAVNSFKIKADGNVLSGLDSVFFSIDLERGLIYNADSLPKGTSVKALIPVISYPSTVSSAIITMTGGEHRQGTIDYVKNPTDSVDFTGDVVLSITAQDGTTRRDYQLKVNVHKMEPDSLWWDKMAVSKLPSRLAGTPLQQRTVSLGDRAVTLLQETDGSYTLSSCQSITDAQWEKSPIVLSFVPDVRSMCSSDQGLYILSQEGDLYSSADGLSWSPTGLTGWDSIIGTFAGRVLGMRLSGGAYTFAEYPAGGIDGEAVPENFPVRGRSDFYTFTNKWSAEPTGICVGGYSADGAALGSTWGFDGTQWANLSAHPAGTVAEGTLIPYFIFRKTSSLWVHTQYSIWLYVGGKNAQGEMNRATYISYDNGVNWYEASELLRLPDYIPAMTQADNVILDTPMEGSFRPQGWTAMPQRDLASWYRVQYDVEGYDVKWNCPYIYLFGGVDEQGNLCNTIWKGVLNRLTFVPLM